MDTRFLDHQLSAAGRDAFLKMVDLPQIFARITPPENVPLRAWIEALCGQPV